MKNIGRMAAILAALTLTLGLAVVPAHAGTAYISSLTVNKRATLSTFGTYVTVTGTYTCTEPTGGLSQENSGLFGGLTQIQGKKVVQGGGDFSQGGQNQIVCDQTPQQFSIQMFANYNDQPATWKKGKAALTLNMGIENGLPGDDPNWDGWGVNTSAVIQIGS